MHMYGYVFTCVRHTHVRHADTCLHSSQYAHPCMHAHNITWACPDTPETHRRIHIQHIHYCTSSNASTYIHTHIQCPSTSLHNVHMHHIRIRITRHVHVHIPTVQARPMHQHTFPHTTSTIVPCRHPPPISCARSLPTCCFRPSLPCTRTCRRGAPPSLWPQRRGTPRPPRRSCRQGPTSRPSSM